ncbi:PepSY domain-containing protein [Planococcus halotolerans]|uniref:PepSY domain-containing protein n=1 Tax=Planococcus halotolerans TaxID=2233542 RepID=A0A365L314_9BACL|nr:PepSY domain-containing protein [Planococcus halotolerans]RAZ79459.1 hypothetical protein DP120_07555 [Planococcus halotolerans]
MKKLILIPATAGVLAFGGIVLANTDSVTGPNTANNNSEDTNNTSTGEMIGFEKASSIALALSDGQVTDIELSDDDGRKQYEVEIRDKDHEYDYEIDAFTGDVLEQDRDRLDDDDDREMNQGGVDGTQAAPEDLIAAEEAFEIALQQSNGGTIVELDLDDDDSVKHYDVEVVNGDKEFELEINAEDGEVLKFEQDENDDDDWVDNDDNDRDED